MKYTSLFISTLVCVCIFYQTYAQDNDLPAGAFVLWKPPGMSRKGFIATFGFGQEAFDILKDRVPVLKQMMSTFHGIKAKEENFTVNFDDILLSPRQVERLIAAYTKALKRKGLVVTFQTPPPQKKRKGRRRKRKILDFAQQPLEKWDTSKDIIYVIDGSFKKKYQDLIVEAIEHWQENTCLNFKRRFPNEAINEDYILFMNEQGCSSHLGRDTGTKPQSIFLSSDVCFPFKAVGIHEIGHALGFLHEQMRLGASKYIDVDLTKIWPNTANVRLQFEPWIKGFQEDFDLPYDYGSIMHYGPLAFASTLDPVITAKNLLFQSSMGQRVELSFIDIKAANIAYECANKCSSPPSCQNGGIPDSRDCNKCICPDGLGGKTCTTVDSDHTNGCTTPQIIDVKSSEQCIQSPKYGSGSYKVGTECNWHLQAPSSNKIKVYFKDDFSVFCEYDASACFHWVEIKYKDPVKSDIPGPRFCCFKTPTQVLVSDGNLVVVSFKGLAEAKANKREGFKLCFKFDDGGVETTTPLTTKSTKQTTATTPKTTPKTTTTTKTTTTVRTTTPKKTPRPTGCRELVCSTMAEWQISTKPKLPQKKFKQAIKGCQPKNLKVKTNIKFTIYSMSPAGTKETFTMKKICVKRVGSKTTQVDLRGKGGSKFHTITFDQDQTCTEDFEDTGKVEEITVVITKKKKAMKISGLEVTVCK